jgi:cell division protein FtsB
MSGKKRPMEIRYTIRIPLDIWDDMNKEAQQSGKPVADVARDRMKYSRSVRTLEEEIHALRKDIEYFIEKDKRREYAEARI